MLVKDLLEVLEYNSTWIKIRTIFDNYIGWIDAKQYTQLSEDTYAKINSFPATVTLDLVEVLENTTLNQLIPLVIGSSLPNLVNNTFYIGEQKFTFDGQVSDSREKPSRNVIMIIAIMCGGQNSMSNEKCIFCGGYFSHQREKIAHSSGDKCLCNDCFDIAYWLIEIFVRVLKDE